MQRLQAKGIKVFDVKDGKREARAFEDVIYDIAQVTKGDAVEIRKLFASEEAELQEGGIRLDMVRRGLGARVGRRLIEPDERDY